MLRIPADFPLLNALKTPSPVTRQDGGQFSSEMETLSSWFQTFREYPSLEELQSHKRKELQKSIFSICLLGMVYHLLYNIFKVGVNGTDKKNTYY